MLHIHTVKAMSDIEKGFMDLYRRLGNVIGCEIANSHTTLRDYISLLFGLIIINTIMIIGIIIILFINNNNGYDECIIHTNTFCEKENSINSCDHKK